MQNKFSEERVLLIMESLVDIQPAVAPDFFYTRLKGRMQLAQEKKTIFIFRPAFITAALSFFLLVNVFSLLTINKTSKQQISSQNDEPATIESFAKAYDMNTESAYE